MEALLNDLRYAARSVARRPAPYLLALITCALGVGATTAMFSVVDRVLLRALPYPDAARIMAVYPTIEEWREHPTLSANWQRGSFSMPEFVEWRAQQTSFEQAAAVAGGSANLTGAGEPIRIGVGQATVDLFPMLGAVPVLGRSFSPGETVAGGADVVLLTHGFWQAYFGGAADVVGRELRMNDVAATIIGVLPPQFRLTGYSVQVWTPLRAPRGDEGRENHGLRVIARLAPGVSEERAVAESSRILAALSEHHAGRLHHRANVLPRLADETRQVRAPLLILLVASFLLLAVSCVNVAALLLGIGIDREQELVVRGAIGAGRGRLVRQLVTESVGLALIAGAVGAVTAFLLMKLLVLLAPAGVPRMDEVSLDGRVLAFTLGLAALVGIGFGLVPALSLTGRDLATRMRGTRVTSQRHRLHGALVLAQLALAAVLLVGGGLLSRTLANLDAVDPGFRADGILTVRVAPPFERFLAGRQGMLVGEAGEFDAAGYDRYHADLAAALAAVPGVQGVARTSILPFSGDRSNNDIEPEGYVPAPGEKLLAERNIVSANYMDLVGMRLLEGRGFSAADDRADAAPVLMVTQNLARHYWPGASAVGRQIKFFRGTFTVIGVIADVRDRALDIAEEERMYIPAGQWSGIGGSYVLRASPGVDPASLAAAVREQIRGVDPDLPVTSILPLRDRIESSLAEYRYRARLMSAFALLALLFAALGIYGVTRRAVASRTREIGIRMALGARRTGVVGMVIRQGAVLALLGGLLGVLAGVAAGRALATFVYGVGTADPVTLLAVALGLPLFGVLASLAPSLRAARVDPVVALRGE